MPRCCLKLRKARQGGSTITVAWNNRCWCLSHWQNRKGNGKLKGAVGQLAGQTMVEDRKTGWFIVAISKTMHVICRITRGANSSANQCPFNISVPPAGSVQKHAPITRPRQWIVIRCDNETSVTVMNTGRAYNSLLLGCLRELEFVAAKWEFEMKAVHIPGVKNRIPDALSHWELGEEHRLRFREVTERLGAEEIYVYPGLFKLCMIGRLEAWMEINLFSCRGVKEAAGGAEEDQEGGIHQRDHSKLSSSMEKLLVVLCLFSVQPGASLDWVCLPVCTVLEPFFQGSHISPKLYQWGMHPACLAGCALSEDW